MTEDDRAACMRVRHVVFVEEQGVPVEEELDEHDATCEHFAAAGDDGEIVGTCRLLRPGPGDARIGRMAVLAAHRGLGYAAELLAVAEAAAAAGGARRITLDAQLTAQGFYERGGYTAHGEMFIDAGIEHIAMTKELGDR